MPSARKGPVKPPKHRPAALTPAVRYVGVMGLRPADPMDLVHLVGKGLSFSTFDHLQRALDVSVQQLANAISIPTRTLHRRRAVGRFEPTESDRLVRLSRIYGRTLDLFEGDQPQARHWLALVQPALGGASPLTMAGTEVGAREVEALIGRLEHGVFS